MKYKLSEICNIINGYAFKSSEYVDKGIRIIRITNVQKGFIEDASPQYYPVERENEIIPYMLKEDDLLISLTGNVGRVGLLPGELVPAALNQRVACLRIKDISKIKKKYLFYALNNTLFEDRCIFSAKGIAQKNMSTAWLGAYEIHVPSMTVQSYICEVLSRVDELLSLYNKQLLLLENLIKSRFVELFGDPVTNPMKWKVKSLSELGDCKNGMNFHKGESGIDIHCLGVGDFQNLSVITDTSVLPIVSLNENPSEEYMLQDGDIVFVRSNGNKNLVGRCLTIYPHDIPTTFSGFCIRYRISNTDKVLTEYLLQVLKHESMRQKMTGRGANIQNLNQQILSALQIPLPPIDLQRQFIEFVELTDKSKLAVQQSTKTLQTLKVKLMQDYFG